MEIDLNNYEAFFLDYYEGKLNVDEVKALYNFLEKHPELTEEFNSFEGIILENEEIFFEEKNSLIRPEVTHFNCEKYLIAESEGDLTSNEKRALENFLAQHSEYNKDRILYSKIKVTPDGSVVFNLKNKIKKSVKKPAVKVIYLYRSVAVAASLVLAILFFTQINKTNVKQPVAEVKSEKKKELKEENKENVNPVNDNQETNTLIEEINLAEIKEEPREYKKDQEIQKNMNVREDIINPRVAISSPQKIEPVFSIEKIELPQAPVLEITDKIQLPEDKDEIADISQPTLAQAAINTMEKMLSGSQHVGEANIGGSVVELAANGLNKLTGKELVNFEKKYDEEGRVRKIQISAGNFGISRTKSR